MNAKNLTVHCPGCRVAYEVGNEMLGRKARCDRCQAEFIIGLAAQPLPRSAAGATAAPGNARGRQGEVAAVQQLWEGSVSDATRPELSIKPPLAAGTTSRSRLVIRPRRIGSAAPDEPSPRSGPTAALAEDADDFEILAKLGEGGMGVVLRARQASIDRLVALKRIRPELADSAAARAGFLAEAVVTGDLEHPNIVPIYDLGSDPDGNLFYAMREVRGTPWHKVLPQKSLAENLDILQRVCDAVAFAHDRGVVHRDLKPENVMLGDYGEVMVMDWGLAVADRPEAKAEPLTPGLGQAGTPAYMAPEMAACDSARIGRLSDVYLLGGILYEIVTGLRPHAAADVYACLHEATQNRIQPTDRAGELVDLALRAMATAPADRYPGVKAFQQALCGYHKHEESSKLTTSARAQLTAAATSGRYEDYAQALFGFREALKAWPENAAARDGVPAASLAYAECASRQGDLDLALSLLDARRPEHAELQARVAGARREREARRRRVRTLTYATVGLAAAILAVLAVAFVVVARQKGRAQVAERNARQAEHTAVQARDSEAKRRAELEYETYVQAIALADSAIREGRVDHAAAVLWRAPVAYRGWEWGHLLHGASQHLLELRGSGVPLGRVSFRPDGRQLVAASADGVLRCWDLVSGELAWSSTCTTDAFGFALSAVFTADGKRILTVRDRKPVLVTADPEARTVAVVPTEGTPARAEFVSRDEQTVLWVASDFIADPFQVRSITGSGQGWQGERGRNVGCPVPFADGRRLALPGYQGKIPILDATNGTLVRELTVPSGEYVNCIAVSPDNSRLLAGQLEGSVRVWNLASDGRDALIARHEGTVTTVTFSPDGESLLSGDWRGRLIVASATGVTADFHALGSGICDLRFSPDGRILATVGDVIRLWRFPMVSRCRQYGGGTLALDVSPDSRRLVYGGWGGAGIVDLDDGTVQPLAPAATLWYSVARFSPDGAYVLLEHNGPQGGELWESRPPRRVRSFGAPSTVCHSGDPFHPDGTRFFFGSQERDAAVYDLRTGAVVTDLKRGAFVGAFSPDGTKVVVRHYEGACVWDVERGTVLRDWPMDAVSTHVDFMPDGNSVLVPRGKDICIEDAASGQPICRLQGHAGNVRSADASPDGKRIASGSDDGSVRIWDALSGRELLVLRYAEGYSMEVTFSRDGLILAAAWGPAVLMDSFSLTAMPADVRAWQEQRRRSWLQFATP